MPDLVQLRYVEDDSIFHGPMVDADGQVTQSFGPTSYKPAADRVAVNSVDGIPRRHTLSNSAATGLGLLIADLDGQGSNDVFVTNKPANFYINEEVRFMDRSFAHRLGLPTLPTLGFGTQAIDYNNDGAVSGSAQSNWLTAGNGYLCRNEPNLHFGVGSRETVDQIEIWWPDASVQRLKNVTVNQRLLIIQGIDQPFSR